MLAACCLLLAWPAATGEPKTPPDLAGRWLLTLPAGFEYVVDLEAGGEAGLYRLRCGATNLSGLYEVRGDTLVLARADNPVMAGMTWDVRNANAAVLASHPDKVGADYRGATLGRQRAARR